MKVICHLFCKGEVSLFRNPEDLIFFNNRFAVYARKAGISVLAETTMGSHFHSVIEYADNDSIKEFCQNLKVSYGVYYAGKYGGKVSEHLVMSQVYLSSVESIKAELTYVMKNPVHHYVADSPFTYPYSCTPYIFLDKMLPEFMHESLNDKLTRLGDISIRRKRRILSHLEGDDNWLVDERDCIVPSSYINLSKTRAYWNNSYKAFLFDMNKNITDASKEVISADILDVRSNSIDDIAVCRIIDDYAKEKGVKSFHFLVEKDMNALLRTLRMNAVTPQQARRCLWLKKDPW